MLTHIKGIKYEQAVASMHVHATLGSSVAKVSDSGERGHVE